MCSSAPGIGSPARVLAILMLALLLAPLPATAQPVPAERRQAVYLELLGNGGLFSVNYEVEFVSHTRARVGFAAWTAESFFGGSTTMMTVPLTVQGLTGRRAHHWEFGGGMLVGTRNRANSFESGAFVSLTGILGYRYQRPDGRFLFRATATPFYGFGREGLAYPEKGFLPSLGVSLGYAF